MQSLTHSLSVDATRTPLRGAVIAVLVALALGLWLMVAVAPATPADAEPLAGRSWIG